MRTSGECAVSQAEDEKIGAESHFLFSMTFSILFGKINTMSYAFTPYLLRLGEFMSLSCFQYPRHRIFTYFASCFAYLWTEVRLLESLMILIRNSWSLHSDEEEFGQNTSV